MIAAFTLREIAVDDGHIAERGRNFRHDDAALRLFIVTREATTHRHRRIFGQQRNAVVAFLTVVKNVIAQLRYLFEREHIVVNFCLLQADHIWLMLLNNRFKLVRAGTQAVDIKRDKFHSRCQCKVNSARMVAEFTSSVIRFAQLLRQIMPTVQYLHHFGAFCPRTGRKGPINFASDHNSRIIFGLCILFLVFMR